MSDSWDSMDGSPPGSAWDFSGKNTGVGCHFLLQRIFSTQRSNLHLLHWQADSLSLSHQGQKTDNSGFHRKDLLLSYITLWGGKQSRRRGAHLSCGSFIPYCAVFFPARCNLPPSYYNLVCTERENREDKQLYTKDVVQKVHTSLSLSR